MTDGNCVRNTQLAALLRDHQKAQSERLKKSLLNFQGHRSSPPPPVPIVAPRGKEPASASSAEGKAKAAPANPQELSKDTVPLTLDEIEWLEDAMERHGLKSIATVFSRLVDWANKESAEAKKTLFLVVRCRRCSAGAKGGVKHDRDIKLSSQQWQWLQNVRERCRHASVGKTLRIIVDFYMALCKDDAAFEQSVLRVRSSEPEAKSVDAINSTPKMQATTAVKAGDDTPVKTMAPLREAAPSPDTKSKGYQSPSRTAGKPLAELQLNTVPQSA